MEYNANQQREQEQIKTFVSFTGASADVARKFLEASVWNVKVATANYFESDHAVSNYKPAAAAASSKYAYKPEPRSGGINTLSSINEKKEDNNNQNYYAGGEKSGIEVTDPNVRNQNLDNFFNKTKEFEKRGEPEAKEKKFGGTAYKLGSSDAPPIAIRPPPEEVEVEVPPIRIAFWKQGFTVDNGPLRAYDDPASQAFMSEIEKGYIPAELQSRATRNARQAEVILEDRKTMDYEPPQVEAPKIVPFSGQGMKLGSDGPAAAVSSSSKNTHASQPQSVNAPNPNDPQARLQIRLADGTTLRARFGQSQTIGDIRAFINASKPECAKRNYILLTPMPRVVFTDSNQTIKDANLDGASIVQKFE